MWLVRRNQQSTWFDETLYYDHFWRCTWFHLLKLTCGLYRGIEPSSTAADIKKAYRKAALRHHPDKVFKQHHIWGWILCICYLLLPWIIVCGSRRVSSCQGVRTEMMVSGKKWLMRSIKMLTDFSRWLERHMQSFRIPPRSDSYYKCIILQKKYPILGWRLYIDPTFLWSGMLILGITVLRVMLEVFLCWIIFAASLVCVFFSCSRTVAC